jgi:type IV secretion system protein VirB4
MNFGLKGKIKSVAETVAQALPYQELYPDGTILTKDWGLIKVWNVMFPDVSMSPVKQQECTDYIAQHYQRRPDGQKDLKVTYWFCTHRVPMKMTLDEKATGAFAMKGGDREVEDYREDMFSDADRNIVSVNYCCCKVEVKVSEEGISPDSRSKAEQVFREFEGAIRTSGSNPVPLQCSDENGMDPPAEHNIMTFIKYCTNMEYRLWKCPKDGMREFSEFVSTLAVQKGKPMRIGHKYVQVMTINDFPSATYSGILSSVLTLSFPFRWTTRWIPNNNKESQAKAKKLRQKYKASMKSWSSTMYEQTSGQQSQNIDTQASVDAQAMEDVLVDLAHGESLGEMTSTITVWDEDIGALSKKIQLIHDNLTAFGFDAIEETVYSNFQAWQSSFAGDSISGRRRPLVTATNLSHIVPFTTLYHGCPTNYYLESLVHVGWPHMTGRLPTQEPFYLNLNGDKDDIGHTFIVGSTGGGKSVFLALMGSQWARYPGSRVILFDKDQSFRNVCERSGDAAIYVPGADDSPLSFMPLARILTKPEEAMAWLELAVESTGTEVNADTSKAIREVCENWDDRPPTLERFFEKLNGRYPECPAIPALRKILSNENLARLFGGETDSFNNDSFKPKTMIEMNALMNMGDMAVLPALHFIFSRMDELFDARYTDENGIDHQLQDLHPTLLVMDEAWLFLRHKVFRNKIKEWLKTLRKKRVFVVMAIQNINDIDDPEEFLTSCYTKIYLANPDLKGEGATKLVEGYKGLGITDEEIKIIGNATRKRDYFIKQNNGGSALVNFCVDSYQLTHIARDGK